ncbi:glycosyltransferase family 2 protein [Legionella sp. PC997]|uniref:glycosyltransferase n=1 Tax=Legionella sp. PC997 TaxID=2755562 RepID=UPI0015F8B248|nr:glycosyltransferase [Legionella sp. PC997]QMT61743.1 hypothetical protein HBNCFIEN_03149 [Legionella sp. PC997]
MYISVKFKFLIVLLIAFAWLSLSIYLTIPWIHDLSEYINWLGAWIIISLIALIPGFMYAFFLASYIFDKRPKIRPVHEWPDISVIVPAHNEESNIVKSIQSVFNQDYAGRFEVIVIDNASTDNTLALLKELKMENLTVLEELTKGKSHALNTGIAKAKYDHVLTLDADTCLMKNALTEIVKKFLNCAHLPTPTAAVAGSIYIQNSRATMITRMQEWEYFHGIAGVKRMQSLFQGTLVAQGNFSLYKKSCITEVGLWQHTVGEDIVLTWGLLLKGYRIDFAEDAIAFANVPETYKKFFLQRSRWARGLIEAFIAYPTILLQPRLITFIVYWNLLFPAMDAAFFFIFIPAVIAALFFGFYLMAGPMTLTVIPLAILLNTILYRGQKKVFQRHNLHVRRNRLGFIFYLLFYNFIMSPACIHGYMSEIFSLQKKWGTK